MDSQIIAERAAEQETPAQAPRPTPPPIPGMDGPFWLGYVYLRRGPDADEATLRALLAPLFADGRATEHPDSPFTAVGELAVDLRDMAAQQDVLAAVMASGYEVWT